MFEINARHFVFPVMIAVACGPSRDELASRSSEVHSDWPHYGGDLGGSRFSPLAQINRDNVDQLRVAWTGRTGELRHDDQPETSGPCQQCHMSDSKFEATPVIADGRLFVSTPLNRVVALHAETGELEWEYNPHIDLDMSRSEGFVSRGVALWEDGEGASGACRRRVFFGTIDANLVALDAATGDLCGDFGTDGLVDLSQGVGEVDEGQYGVTSPPLVIGDVVVVGSAVGDNRRVEMERGTVRGFNARNGELLWSWDPIPRRPGMPGYETWTPEAARRNGGANAWPPLSADAERGLVFVPTGAAAPDFYGGERLGANLYSNSLVALHASTGEIAWHYQVVHHDLWDYDIPAQPVLVTVVRDGVEVPGVAVVTKMGFVFVLDRESGEPLFPVEERPVPASSVAGEEAWPTQPFPVVPPPLHPQSLSPDDAWGVTDEDRASCRQQLEGLRYEGMFTPPSLEGTLVYPGYAGGMNWNGMAFHPEGRVLVTMVNRIATWVRLHERAPGSTSGNQLGTPYSMSRAVITAPSGMLCAPPPWGTVIAVSLDSGDVLWEKPLGRVPQLAGVPGAEQWGSIGFGGPIVTAGGLVFIGASMDDFIRAFDVETGDMLWEAPLPAGGQATPMTYEINGRQYIVIAAGGHGRLGTTQGDFVVAFALPE
jgi:quinoprotein glucose dehydrogenase